MIYRKLTNLEISQLIANRCRTLNWDSIEVKDEFNADFFYSVCFEGEVKIGSMSAEKAFDKKIGIYESTIENSIVEDNVFINKVGRISNYIIRSNSYIELCGSIISSANATFGNGETARVVNEAGGRDVLLYDQLTASNAWLQSFVKEKKLFQENLKSSILNQIKINIPEKGIIGHWSQIIHATAIKNVKIGDHSSIDGALLIKNGTILSTKKAKTTVGFGVILENFILAPGSQVLNASIIKNCFIGQGCIIDKQFSAENSLFFANSQLFHGEACSVFGGPYTVSHHKSTLLIAMGCSFVNVGSGSNQSNHMYKLGPLHQGILERGCKLSSDSYLLWPAKIAPFTFIMGRHYSNPDISQFPFSYLIEDKGESYLVPGANFRSIGTLRDALKWTERDMREDSKNDLIHFDLVSPSIIYKALEGIKILKELDSRPKPENNTFLLGNVRIKKTSIKRGIDIYEEMIKIYCGDIIKELIHKKDFTEHFSQIISNKKDRTAFDKNGWLDMAGQLLSTHQFNHLVQFIESNPLVDNYLIDEMLQSFFKQKNEAEITWLITNSQHICGLDLTIDYKTNFTTLINSWESAKLRFYDMLLKDAQKEFNTLSSTSYGLSEELNAPQAEFIAVRGELNANSFYQLINQKVVELKTESSNLKQLINS